MTWRKLVDGLAWALTLLPCAFCLGAGAALTATGRFIQDAYLAVHVWAHPGTYPNGKL